MRENTPAGDIEHNTNRSDFLKVQVEDMYIHYNHPDWVTPVLILNTDDGRAICIGLTEGASQIPCIKALDRNARR